MVLNDGSRPRNVTLTIAPELEGVLCVLPLLPLILDAWFADTWTVAAPLWRSAALCLATVSLLFTAVKLRAHPRLGRLSAVLGLAASMALLFPELPSSPAIALLLGVGCCLFLHLLFAPANYGRHKKSVTPASRTAQVSRSTAWAALALLFVVGFFYDHSSRVPFLAAVSGAGIAAGWSIRWSWLSPRPTNRRALLLWTGCSLVSALVVLGLWFPNLLLAAWIWPLLTLILVPAHSSKRLQVTGTWWDPLLDHPGRYLLTTFLVLCVLGTFLLSLPWATTANAGIDSLDAAFTAVSAVCVTGLIVLDTPHDFTVWGQCIILLLIHVGGLGIMSLSTVAFHSFGRRLSLRQERVASALAGEQRHALHQSLRFVLIFTFTVEAIGAVLLTACFLMHGDGLGMACWRGTFTAVSAFCNAGFALQSDSLIPYQSDSMVLHTVAILIVVGGLSPVVAAMVPAWLRGKRCSVHASLALLVSVILLGFGTIGYLVMEWNSSLHGLSLADRLHNAWFQSVTFRTAGFNSVDIAQMTPGTHFMAMLLMFIGGCPGGTAGGIKTTTVAILTLATLTAVIGHGRTNFRRHYIPNVTVFRSLAIVTSGVVIWILTYGALLLTQSIPASDLMFEATSALGTVGLSTGATGQLDGLGKVIIIFAMFLGRVGPLTLFTVFGSSEHTHSEHVRMPEAHIGIT